MPKSVKKKKLEITTAEFSKLHARLKALDIKWMPTFVDYCNKRIKTEVEFKGLEEINNRNVYNVFNGVVRSPQKRKFVFQMAIDYLKQEEAAATTELTELKSQLHEL
jgi:hypothetical protein